MKDASCGFPGDNVRIRETINNKYEVPYLNYVISHALDDLTEVEKFKIVRFMIRTFQKDWMFPRECYVRRKKDIDLLLKHCEKETERLKNNRPFLKPPFIGY